MRPLSDLSGVTATWRGVLRWKPHFRLESAGRLFATLDWETASGSLAVARSHGQLTLIERGHFASTRITLRRDPVGPESGVYAGGWSGGGRLRLVTGREFRIAPTARALGRWAAIDASSRVLMEVSVDRLRLLPGGTLRMDAAALEMPEQAELLALAWYLAVQAVDDGSLLVPEQLVAAMA